MVDIYRGQDIHNVPGFIATQQYILVTSIVSVLILPNVVVTSITNPIVFLCTSRFWFRQSHVFHAFLQRFWYRHLFHKNILEYNLIPILPVSYFGSNNICAYIYLFCNNTLQVLSRVFQWSNHTCICLQIDSFCKLYFCQKNRYQ